MKRSKRFLCALLAALNLFVSLPVFGTAEKEEIDAVLSLRAGEAGAERLLDTVLAPNAGMTDSDWFALVLGRLGRIEGKETYLAMLERYVRDKYASEGRLDAHKVTEWHRIALTVLSLGGDPTSFAGVDLIRDGVFFRAETAPLDAQGISGLVYALITADAMDYRVPDGAADDRRSILASLLSYQNADGGFPQIMRLSDPDTTAMALVALAPYLSSEADFGGRKVRDAVSSALAYLSGVQLSDGTFRSMGTVNCESTAQVILALTALGIGTDDPRFIKDRDLLSALESFRAADGGYRHTREEEDSSRMAGQQALLAKIALRRRECGMRSVYDFRAEDPAAMREAEALDRRIAAMTADEAETLYGEYLRLPVSERRYVPSVPVLYGYLTGVGITPADEPALYTGQTVSGNGTVSDPFGSPEAEETGAEETGGDTGTGTALPRELLDAIRALPDKVTLGQESEVLRLLAALRDCPDRAAYAEEEEALNGRLTAIDGIRAELRALEEEIASYLMSPDDPAVGRALAARAGKLEEEDRARLTRLGELELVLAGKGAERRSGLVTRCVVGALVLAAGAAAAGILHRKQKKKKEKEVNPDW